MLKSIKGKSPSKSTGGQKATNEGSKQNIYMAILRGVIYALILSVIGILAFALVLKLMPDLTESVIGPVNQVLKIVSVLVGAWFAVGGYGGKGWLVGGLTGLCYMIVGFVIYGIMEGTLGAFSVMLSDAVLGFTSGCIGGILTVNIKKK